MGRYISIVLVVLMTFISGCNKTKEVDKIIIPYEKIDFMDEVMDIRTFTVSDKGELFIIKGGVLARYTHDGTFIKEYAPKDFEWGSVAIPASETYQREARKKRFLQVC